MPLNELVQKSEAYLDQKLCAELLAAGSDPVNRFTMYHTLPICLSNHIKAVVAQFKTQTLSTFKLPLEFRNSESRQGCIIGKKFGIITFDLRDGRMR